MRFGYLAATLILALPLSSSWAFDYSALPACSHQPAVSVPPELQGTYLLQPEKPNSKHYTFIIDNQGLRSDTHVYSTEIPGRKEPYVFTEAVAVKNGYCVGTSLHSDESGVTTLTTEVWKSSFGRRALATTESIKIQVMYDKTSDYYGVRSASRAVAYLFYFIPIAGGGMGFGNFHPLLKIADNVEPRSAPSPESPQNEGINPNNSN